MNVLFKQLTRARQESFALVTTTKQKQTKSIRAEVDIDTDTQLCSAAMSGLRLNIHPETRPRSNGRA
ncbi:hypothetical protein RB195_000892 [Necator americanus]|uniref:Uncharacterized protein n=1 Tax=Necator americanus TaxID=51031 RepID=A0ABR1DBW6_NECAM